MSDTVSNIATLKSLSVPPATNEVFVKCYQTTNDLGGGWFYYDSAAAVGEDGGTIFTPNSNPATGRWIRADQSQITFRMFGAKGDGSTNDRTALINAINVTNQVYGIAGDVYKITATITINKNITIDCLGARGGNNRFSILTESGSGCAISIGEPQLRCDGTVDTGVINPGSFEITATLTTSPAPKAPPQVGDLIILHVYKWGTNPTKTYNPMKGEVTRIDNIDSNKLRLATCIVDYYNVKNSGASDGDDYVEVKVYEPISAQLRNFDILYAAQNSGSTYPSDMGIKLGKTMYDRVENVRVFNAFDRGFYFAETFNSQLQNCFVTGSKNYANGYGVMAASSNGFSVSGSTFVNCKRGVDFSGENFSPLSRFCTARNNIVDGSGYNTLSTPAPFVDVSIGPGSQEIYCAGIGTHHNSYKAVFESNIIKNVHDGITVRGLYDSYINNQFINVKGHLAHLAGGKGLVYKGNEHISSSDYYVPVGLYGTEYQFDQTETIIENNKLCIQRFLVKGHKRLVIKNNTITFKLFSTASNPYSTLVFDGENDYPIHTLTDSVIRNNRVIVEKNVQGSTTCHFPYMLSKLYLDNSYHEFSDVPLPLQVPVHSCPMLQSDGTLQLNNGNPPNPPPKWEFINEKILKLDTNGYNNELDIGYTNYTIYWRGQIDQFMFNTQNPPSSPTTVDPDTFFNLNFLTLEINENLSNIYAKKLQVGVDGTGAVCTSFSLTDLGNEMTVILVCDRKRGRTLYVNGLPVSFDPRIDNHANAYLVPSVDVSKGYFSTAEFRVYNLALSTNEIEGVQGLIPAWLHGASSKHNLFSASLSSLNSKKKVFLKIGANESVTIDGTTYNSSNASEGFELLISGPGAVTNVVTTTPSTSVINYIGLVAHWRQEDISSSAQQWVDNEKGLKFIGSTGGFPSYIAC